MLEYDVCRSQIMTAQVDPRTQRVNIYNGRGLIGVQMKLKEISKTFMMISN